MSQYTLDLKGQLFSGARFGRYLSLYCRTNRSYILSYFTIMIFGMIACEIVVPLVTRFKDYDHPENLDIYALTGGILSGIFASIMLFEGGRRVYNRMARPDIKNTMMVPASQLEKTLVWSLIWIIGSWAAAILTFAAAEALRIGVSHIFAAHPEAIESVWDYRNKFNFPDIAMMVSSLLCSQAMFVLAGTVWYRNVWVKMIALSFCIQTITSIVLFGVMMTKLNSTEHVSFGSGFSQALEHTIVTSATVYACIGAVACYLIAYFRNKENGINFRW